MLLVKVKNDNIKGYLKTLIASLIASSILLEGLIASMLAFPFLSKFGLLPIIQNVYMGEFRNIIQFEPRCGRYDSELAYTLKPGGFFFSNPEFNNEFRVNSLGVRDDEYSLIAPEIIVIGDSHAMGWGVNQEETYAQIIEQKSALKVLNAAISSYGTVREMRMLNRLDTTKLKYLIIHYDKTDPWENESFYEKNTLSIMDETTYKQIVKDYMKKKRYYPGKYVISTIKYTQKNIIHYLSSNRKLLKKNERKNETKFFLNALINASRIDLSKVKIIVIGNNDFISDLKKGIPSNDYPDYVKNITTVNLSTMIKRDGYYLIDPHLNNKGHKTIADEILKIIIE